MTKIAGKKTKYKYFKFAKRVNTQHIKEKHLDFEYIAIQEGLEHKLIQDWDRMNIKYSEIDESQYPYDRNNYIEV